MNTQENEVSSAVATQSAPVASQLITLDPATYVTEVFQPFLDKFAALKAEADAITPDASTPAGMEICIKYRASFRDDVRIAGEKARVDRKAPILAIGKLLDSRYAELKTEVLPYEAKFDAAIEAEKKRKEEIKAAEKAREEQTRMRLVAMRELPLGAIGKSSAEIGAMLEALAADDPGEDFGMLLDAAKSAHADAMSKLTTARDAAQASEAEAARVAAERAELAELREAAAARARLAQEEAERVAAVQRAEEGRIKALAAEQEAAALREREAAAIQLKKEADAQAEKNRLAQAEIDRQMAELNAAKAAQAKADADRQAAADQAERDRVAAEQARVDAEAQAALDARLKEERDAEAERQSAIVATQPASVAVETAPVADLLQSQDDVVAVPPSMRLGHINERIAPLSINADGLRQLGFEHAATDKAAKLFNESDFPAMCAAIIAHVAAAQSKHAA